MRASSFGAKRWTICWVATSDMATYRRRPAVERRLLGGRFLVQPIDAAAPTELGGSAPIIWELLADHRHLAGVMQLLSERFDDPPDVIEKGTNLAIRQMLDAGLIDEVDA